MKLAVEGPTEFQGVVLKTIMQRRGIVIGTTEEEGFSRVEAEVPLAEMFGYATDLRSSTQGKAEFTMEFARYLPAPVRGAEGAARRSTAPRSRTTTSDEREGERRLYKKFLNARSPLRLLEKGLHGGLGAGNLGVVLAGHGVGKTAFLVGVALDELLRAGRVLHVCLRPHGRPRARPLRHGLRRARGVDAPRERARAARRDRPPPQHPRLSAQHAHRLASCATR